MIEVQTKVERFKLRVEKILGVVFGYYKLPREKRLGPWGLVFVGPIGIVNFESWFRSWWGATGFEVTVLGRSVYLAWRDPDPLSVSVVLAVPAAIIAAVVAVLVVVI